MIHIFGSSGFLGSNLNKFLTKKKINFLTFTSKKNKTDNKKNFYLYSKKSFKKIQNNDQIIFLLAPTNVKKIEEKKKFFLKYNNKIKKILKLINRNVYILYISSDYVYSGNQNIYNDNSIARPINFYGKLKFDIENFIKKNFNNYIILRSPKIYSNNNTLDTIYGDIYNKLKKGIKFQVFYDQKIQLLNLNDFLIIILKILKKTPKIVGTFNLVGKSITRYQFSKKIAKKFNLKTNNILPIKIKRYSNLNLPKKLVLKTNLYKKLRFDYKFKI